MERVRQQLLELNRCSLWGGTPSATLFEGDVDWTTLLAQAKQQSILGSVYSQVEGLCSRPSAASIMRLHKLTTLNRTMQLKQLQAIGEISRRFKQAGIERPVLLKGLGVTYNYLDPRLRQCGDVDIYVGKKNYEKACSLAKSWSESDTSDSDMTHKHFDFSFNGIPIEIHRIVITNSNITRNSSKFSDWCIENLEGENLREELIEGVRVYLPPYNFDAIYIFFHAWNHFCFYGIAFRQLCDWCRHLTKHHDKIDKQRLAADIERFGLVRPWGFFSSVAVTHLGLDKSMLVCFDKSREWQTERVTQRIWQGGNFGFYGGHMASAGVSTLKRKLINFTALFRSFAYLHSIDKPYSYNFLFRGTFNSIMGNIHLLLYKIAGK